MPSKLRKAISAVKDRTSIGLAKVSRTAAGGSLSSQLDLLVLKVTTHDDLPTDNRRIDDILVLASSTRANAATCASAISRRLDRTHDWVVAIKCLHLIHRLLRDGGPFFPFEALSVMHRGSRLLDLLGFRDESSHKNPWDHATFVRALASYLDERLRCAFLDKLHGLPDKKHDAKRMAGLLDRIGHWQRLLDRAVATAPTGLARRNRLVQASLQEVVRESFEVYMDAREGLGVLLDGFLHMERRERVEAYHACVRSSRQAVELVGFYESCGSAGVGRGAGECPRVEGVPAEVLRRLEGFLRASKGTCHELKELRVEEEEEEEEDWEVVLMETASTIAKERGQGEEGRPTVKEDKNPFLEDKMWMPSTCMGDSGGVGAADVLRGGGGRWRDFGGGAPPVWVGEDDEGGAKGVVGRAEKDHR